MDRVEAGVVVSSLRETMESWALVRVVPALRTYSLSSGSPRPPPLNQRPAPASDSTEELRKR